MATGPSTRRLHRAVGFYESALAARPGDLGRDEWMARPRRTGRAVGRPASPSIASDGPTGRRLPWPAWSTTRSTRARSRRCWRRASVCFDPTPYWRLPGRCGRSPSAGGGLLLATYCRHFGIDPSPAVRSPRGIASVVLHGEVRGMTASQRGWPSSPASGCADAPAQKARRSRPPHRRARRSESVPHSQEHLQAVRTLHGHGTLHDLRAATRRVL